MPQLEFEEISVSSSKPSGQIFTFFDIRENGEHILDTGLVNKPYQISEVNGRSKWTEDAEACAISLVLAIRRDGVPVSFLAHIDPWALQEEEWAAFERDYTNRLDEIASGAAKEAIFPYITGGVKGEPWHAPYEYMARKIAGLNANTLEVVSCIGNPKLEFGGCTNLFLDTPNRQAYALVSDSRSSYREFLKSSGVVLGVMSPL